MVFSLHLPSHPLIRYSHEAHVGLAEVAVVGALGGLPGALVSRQARLIHTGLLTQH